MGRRATYTKPVVEEQTSLFEDEELFDKEPNPVQEEAPKNELKKEDASKKEFKDTDKIPCVSITIGGLSIVGDKSGNFYHWQTMGDVVDVEYRDLVSAVRMHSKDIFEPRIIIQDDAFLAKYDTVQVRYGELYTPADIEMVLTLAPEQLRANLKKMPVGAQTAVKELASRKVASGELDSVNRIKVLDEFFGTQLVLLLMQ